MLLLPRGICALLADLFCVQIVRDLKGQDTHRPGSLPGAECTTPQMKPRKGGIMGRSKICCLKEIIVS